MKPESARSLWIFSLILAVSASLIPSPSGRFFFSIVALLFALPPTIFGPGRARLGGAVAGILSLVLAVTGFPAMQKEQSIYVERINRKNTGTIVTSPGLPGLVLATPKQECGEYVALSELIANPDVYHGQLLRVVAYITVDFEYMTACPDENNTDINNCLWLDIGDGPVNTEQDYERYQSLLRIWNRFNRETVDIHGTFDKNERGHFSMWPGSLVGITEVSGNKESWNFISNIPMTRTACIGESIRETLPLGN